VAWLQSVWHAYACHVAHSGTSERAQRHQPCERANCGVMHGSRALVSSIGRTGGIFRRRFGYRGCEGTNKVPHAWLQERRLDADEMEDE
jgi:hypothetical protein